MCNLFLPVSDLSFKWGFLLSLVNLLDLNLHLMFFALRDPSLQSTWLLQRSIPVCCPFCCFCVTPFHTSSVLCCCSSSDFLTVCTWIFSTRLLSASQLQSSFQSKLGVLLPSRQPSILVLLPCVDDFQYLCFSSSVQLLSFFETLFSTSRPAVGTALSVLLIISCCWVCFSPAVGCALLACCWLCSSAALLR